MSSRAIRAQAGAARPSKILAAARIVRQEFSPSGVGGDLGPIETQTERKNGQPRRRALTAERCQGQDR